MKDDFDIKDKLLVVMIGLSHSGKSTYAKTLASNFSCPIVSTDAIRQVVSDGEYNPYMDREIFETASTMVQSLFVSGSRLVIYDACNLTTWAREQFQFGQQTEYVYMKTTKTVCKKRAKDRGLEYMIPIIDSMEERLQLPKGVSLSEVVYNKEADRYGVKHGQLIETLRKC